MIWVKYGVTANDGAKVHHNCEAAKGCCVFFARRRVKGTHRTYIHTKKQGEHPSLGALPFSMRMSQNAGII